MDGTVNFYRTWDHYKKGFGNKDGEYWLGKAVSTHLTFPLNYNSYLPCHLDLNTFMTSVPPDSCKGLL